MRDETPSWTAAWVACMRGLGMRLPDTLRLAEDPYGTAFGGMLGRMAGQAPLPVRFVPALREWVLYMQVRTRLLDDMVRDFVAAGGDQVVLLGAGYDCRALRMPELAGAAVFEVDHPATQEHKRAVLESLGAANPAHLLAWHFERRPMEELPGALAGLGHDPTRPTLTLWEGVTMYLTEPAIDASFRAVAAWSAPGSALAMTYGPRSRVERPSPAERLVKRVVASFGEPFTWGWNPGELAPWAARRGFTVERDVSITEAFHALLGNTRGPADLAMTGATRSSTALLAPGSQPSP